MVLFEVCLKCFWRNKKTEFLGQFQKKLPSTPGEKSLWSCGFKHPPPRPEAPGEIHISRHTAPCNLPPYMVFYL